MTLRKRRIWLLVCVFVFIIIAPVINLYISGYRLTSNLKIIKTGGIYIHSPENSAKIYLNGKYKKQIGIIQNGIFLQNLKPEKYTVLLGYEGFWPWEKKIEVKEEQVTELKPILISQNPKNEVILRGSFIKLYYSPFQKILAFAEKNKKGLYKINFYLPQENLFLNPQNSTSLVSIVFKNPPRLLWDKNSAVLISDPSFKKEPSIKVIFNLDSQNFEAKKISKSEETEILTMSDDFKNFKSSEIKNFDFYFAKMTAKKKEMIWFDNFKNVIWFDININESELPYFMYNEKKIIPPLKIMDSRFIISNIDFFPGRRDVIIASISNGVYAAELDGRGGRLFQPIYKGKHPDFAIFKGEKIIYILDDGNLLRVEL